MKLSLLIVLAAALQAGAAVAAPTPDQQAAHVLNRLAFGPRPGDIDRVKAMGVQNYIASQLDPASIALPASLQARLATLETANASAGAALGEFVALRREVRDEAEGARARRRDALARMTRETAEARLLRAIDSPRQLEEVMVDFWFNHFNVFSGKGIDRALIASYERDAIRPNALGSFRALLGATAHHPAMLFYLDNYLSTAARTKAQGKQGGLNENYARELMELHTLGVDNGYTQQDVTALARMLTGWTFDARRLARNDETFRFERARHDNGAKTWLGRTVAPDGQREGEAALDVLAMHPATARHISYQLAQYFVQDEPPPALVARMAAAWQASGGDIRTVLRTLFASDEFMAPAALGAKFKTPYRYVLSVARAAGAPVTDVQPLLGALNQLGMPLYGCQTPDGYKNTEKAWLNPDALARRIAFAGALAGGRLALGAPETTFDAALAPRAAVPDATWLEETLGGTLSAHTRDIVAQHPAPLRAAMLLGSPDFMQH